MPNILQQGQAWLAKQLTEHASQRVTYKRGNHEAQLDATIGRSTFQQESTSGVILEVETRDYLVDTASLVFNRMMFLPRAGDLIIETLGDLQLVHEVLSMGSEPPFRYCDPFRLKVRIHTKFVGTGV